MKLKIISDGTSFGTKIINAETGIQMKNVESFELIVSSNEKHAKCKLTLIDVPVEIEYSGDVLLEKAKCHICKGSGKVKIHNLKENCKVCKGSGKIQGFIEEGSDDT